MRRSSPAPDSVEPCLKAIALYRGDLLPDDLNEPWSEEPRDRLRSRYQQLLRGARRWHDLLRLDPADEEAHVELLREAVLAGDRAAALRRYDEMERILDQELGVGPGPEAVALRERILAPPTAAAAAMSPPRCRPPGAVSPAPDRDRGEGSADTPGTGRRAGRRCSGWCGRWCGPDAVGSRSSPARPAAGSRR